MAPAGKRAKLSVTTRWPRSSSVELDEDSSAVQFNEHGRPIRTRKQPVKYSGYVETEKAIPVEDDESSDEDYTDMKRPLTSTRHKRFKSPNPPLMSPPPLDDVPNARKSRTPLSPLRSLGSSQVSLTFNVPQQHQGPFIVNLDLQALFGHSLVDFSPLPPESVTTLSSVISSSASGTYGDRRTLLKGNLRDVLNEERERMIPKNPGFLDLPAELRNIIYRMMFATDAPISLINPKNFCRSGQFLQVCKQVQREGTAILYGENRFKFVRQHRQRAIYWQPEWTEVGFKDMRIFLKTIGSNLGLIRDMRILLDDQSPSAGPNNSTAETRRFVNDEVLLECLKILGESSRLQKLSIGIYGRRMLYSTDHRFLSLLTNIKADTVKILGSNICHYSAVRFWVRRSNLYHSFAGSLIQKMTRKEPLYPGPPIPDEDDE